MLLLEWLILQPIYFLLSPLFKLRDWICMHLITYFYLKGFAVGGFDVTFPDGTNIVYGDENAAFRGVPKKGAGDAASELLKLAKPALFVKLFDALKMEQCLVFCRTNLDCDLFERYLVSLGDAHAGKKQAAGWVAIVFNFTSTYRRRPFPGPKLSQSRDFVQSMSL